MAILKYIDENGIARNITGFGPSVVQSTGQSTTTVMSLKAVTDNLLEISEKIPVEATQTNLLADKEFVNSSVSTNTATFRGTNETTDIESDFITWANELTHDNNDYVFWKTSDEAGNTLYKRYKYDGTSWVFEYSLNNSSFTSELWATINSGINTNTNVSTFTNDAGYLTEHLDISSKADKSDTYTKTEVDTKLNNKADTEDLEEATVSNLVGYSTQEAEFTYRPTAGALDIKSDIIDAGGKVDGIKGNTIVWNLVVRNGDFSNDISEWYTSTGQVINNIFVFKNNSSTEYNKQTYQSNTFVASHKHYISFFAAASNPAEFRTIGIQSPYLNPIKHFSVSNELSNFKSIIIPAGSDLFLRFSDAFGNADDTFQISYVQAFDLTLIYGSGNEPSTPEEFEADYEKWFGKPLTYEPYNAGTLIPVKSTGIKTVGFNLYNNGSARVINGEQYQISGTYTSITLNDTDITPDANGLFTPSTGGTLVVSGGASDTCVHLVHSGTKNGEYEPYWTDTKSLPITTLKGKANGTGESVVVFPDGMKKAGSVYDEIYTDANGVTHAIKRVGKQTVNSSDIINEGVNLYNIQYARTGNDLFQDRKNGDWESFDNKTTCPKFDIKPYNIDYTYMAQGFWGINSGILCCTIPEYNTIETLSALCPFDVYYELATPIDYILDDFELPVLYKADDFGTEEIVSDNTEGSTPVSCSPKLSITYGLNAPDSIRNLTRNYVSATQEQNFTDGQKARARKNIDAINADDIYSLTRITDRTRKTDFDLNILKQAVAEQNLEKYGLKVGDQKTINGRTYVIAGLNPMKGTSTPYRLTQNHVGLIVIPHTIHAWNTSGKTSEGADGRGAGYANCDLHNYLKKTLLPLVKTDLGENNLYAHSKLLTNAVNTEGYNRYGSAGGCSSAWGWVTDQYICALSEVQVYGGTVWSSSGYDTGEACRQLDVFRHYNHNEIFGSEYPWLRDVVSASSAAFAYDTGHAGYHIASYAACVAALILFH